MNLNIDQVRAAVEHLSERNGGYHHTHIMTLMVLGLNAAVELIKKDDGVEVDITALIDKLPFGFLFQWNPVSELPLQTYNWSSQDVLVCTRYNLLIGRTRDRKWIDTRNEPIEDVLFWSDIPLPTQMEQEAEELRGMLN